MPAIVRCLISAMVALCLVVASSCIAGMLHRSRGGDSVRALSRVLAGKGEGRWRAGRRNQSKCARIHLRIRGAFRRAIAASCRQSGRAFRDVSGTNSVDSLVSEPVAGGRIASGRVPTAVRERGVRDRARGRRTADAGAPQGPPVSAPGLEALNLRRSASRLSRSQDAS